MSTVLSEPTISAIFLSDWLSSPSRTRPTNSCEPCPLSQFTICRADFLPLTSVSLEAEGELKDGCMTSCHSALTPTSVPSLCISVTCVPWRWPAPINQLSALLPRPHLALSALPSPPFFFTDSSCLSALLILPAYPSLVSILSMYRTCTADVNPRAGWRNGSLGSVTMFEASWASSVGIN